MAQLSARLAFSRETIEATDDKCFTLRSSLHVSGAYRPPSSPSCLRPIPSWPRPINVSTPVRRSRTSRGELSASIISSLDQQFIVGAASRIQFPLSATASHYNSRLHVEEEEERKRKNEEVEKEEEEGEKRSRRRGERGKRTSRRVHQCFVRQNIHRCRIVASSSEEDDSEYVFSVSSGQFRFVLRTPLLQHE